MFYTLLRYIDFPASKIWKFDIPDTKVTLSARIGLNKINALNIIYNQYKVMVFADFVNKFLVILL